MQARIARLDTSNLSTYSVPTLRRLAKDMGLSNTARLSKSELVVQLVSEIILANMALGWGVPEVAQGVLADDGDADNGYSSSDDEDATVYRFSDARGHVEVEVEDALPPGVLQRGRESARRVSRDFSGSAVTGIASPPSPVAARISAAHQLDVDADFESLSKLSMSELQTLCEDLAIEGWASMRKFEMISALLLDVYEIER
jgi:hypothetical protein